MFTNLYEKRVTSSMAINRDLSQFQPVTQPGVQQNEEPIREDPLSDIIE